MASACGIDGTIQGASSGVAGTSGTSGAAGTSGSAGTSGTSGTSGSTSGDAAPKTDVTELFESTDLRGIAVGADKLVFAESDGLWWCEAATCPARTGASNPLVPAPTAITFADAKFYGTFGAQLHACEPKANAVDCNGADSATDPLFTGATRLRFDGASFVWTKDTTVRWVQAGGSTIQDVAGGTGHDGIALAGDTLFFTSTGNMGRALRIDDFLGTAMGGTGPSSKVSIANNLVGANDIVSDGSIVVFAVSGDATAANGYVQSCKVSSNECTKPIQGLARPKGVALDANDIFVSDTGSNRVLRVPRNGGSFAVIATNLVSPTDIVLDNANAYVIAIDSAGKRRAYRVKKNP